MRKYEITAEKVIQQLARIALANPRDYVDVTGEALDLGNGEALDLRNLTTIKR